MDYDNDYCHEFDYMCPKCNEWIDPDKNKSGHYCPYCGSELDSFEH